MTNIKDLWKQFRDSLPDRTLAKDVNLEVVVKFEPSNNKFLSDQIILQDNTGSIEGFTEKKNISDYLKTVDGINKKIKIKGDLVKHEFDDLVFIIKSVAI
ncbi:MAG: hypothetical protein HY094_06560 [Candidatus Melainabacteria bacterium]|nr:hypothetical protein [Candidatus Melainabacteria bacterium]